MGFDDRHPGMVEDQTDVVVKTGFNQDVHSLFHSVTNFKLLDCLASGEKGVVGVDIDTGLSLSSVRKW